MKKIRFSGFWITLTTGKIGEGRGLADVALAEVEDGCGGQTPPRRKKVVPLPGEYKSKPMMEWAYRMQMLGSRRVPRPKLTHSAFASQRALQPANVPETRSA